MTLANRIELLSIGLIMIGLMAWHPGLALLFGGAYGMIVSWGMDRGGS